ncbi:carbohydrate kinase family protein [Frigidibacter sp. ROC022]|uniref:carbohydrate kinase family protein n=1 Tax=Frigidibacter sp. ROC022 TaxID=2971796 RepID=UPI00215A54F4|nr:PfkB family carbohydrate kinase [Frigidibacter sp. ROC022]MCR8722766.1 PfkB family carbohydrate kinase [Frigidibacter sp. ROC022]
MTFDYTALGFHTFDALCRPVSALSPDGSTTFVEDFAIAISGAAGSAAVVAAKHGLSVQAVGGVGNDLMGDWVLRRFADFGVDTEMMQRCDGVATSSSIVTTRPDGQRPALHKLGATGAFYVDDAQVDRVLDTRILHVGGVGLMDAMDRGRNAEIMAEASKRGITTTLDVFASKPEDFARVQPLLPHTDYFMPSEEEAAALSGLTDLEDIASFLLDQGTGAVILTLGPNGAMYRGQDGTRIDLPAYAIDMVCSCGCGDCFNAGFATGLHLGRSLTDCIRIAQATSALNATGLGSQAGVTSLEETLKFMETAPLRGYDDDITTGRHDETDAIPSRPEDASARHVPRGS